MILAFTEESFSVLGALRIDADVQEACGIVPGLRVREAPAVWPCVLTPLLNINLLTPSGWLWACSLSYHALLCLREFSINKAWHSKSEQGWARCTWCQWESFLPRVCKLVPSQGVHFSTASRWILSFFNFERSLPATRKQ